MTRHHGVVVSAANLVPSGHLGWGYRDRAEFLARAGEYLADGLDQHQWVEYVGADHATLRAELAAMPKIAGHRRAHDIKIKTIPEFYALRAGSDVIDIDRTLTGLNTVVDKALADGYTGYRVASDATAMARTPEQRSEHACYEALFDQRAAVEPVSALCGYNLNELGHHAHELICLHPYTNQRALPFRLYHQPGTDFALTGNIDAASQELLSTTLEHLTPLPTGTTVIIDAQHLDFIGHRQLAILDQHAHTQEKQIILQTNQPVPTRLVDLLHLANVRAQQPPQPQYEQPNKTQLQP